MAEATKTERTEPKKESIKVQEQREQELQEVNRFKLTFDDEVIKKVTAIATRQTDGILGMSGSVFEGLSERFGATQNISKGISAEVGEKQVALDIDVIIEYGKSIPTIYQTVQDNVSNAIREMTGLEVIEFNMHVEDVLTRKEYEEKENRSNQTSTTDRVE
ncbi:MULTISPECIES: Asp23/Gls24 family envelope stress response protein [unclassified Geomicrobium]|uniref:Asp23/Gls24 family envelope stress response protein n=1 Tax=unclassified Geomicrobium TaxID=2628951 RepID=UPI00045EDAA8|nr:MULTISPECIES: Asp23/Gls24 family envelope stress response protein [unclassified Geomicrobium]GAJ98380.1 alkaline shock protein [Geomicrobium sp. JCM 19055]GAK07595.1 alkaline shock protein [Geomicrobium sp. JCM 19038]